MFPASRLAFSTNAYKSSTFEEAVASIARLGYAGCEVMADQPHLVPTELGDAGRRRVAATLVDRRLACSNVNAFTGFFAGDTYRPTWINGDVEARQTRIRHTLASIELAAELQAPTVSLQPGGPTINEHCSPAEAAGRFADGLHEVLPRAQELGVTLAVEPEPGLLLESAAEYLAFKRQFFVGEPRIKMNCDLGHAFCVGENPATLIREHPEEIAHVHLEDIAASRVHQHLVPGDGALDFPGIFAALEEINYGGWVTVELYPFEDDAEAVARRALDHLRPLLA
jgi:sugar phosphate isomerase/epimerase